MFNLSLRSANDGISSGPQGSPRSNGSQGGCKEQEEWECHNTSEWFADAVQTCDQHCMSIGTCVPYDEPEHEGANDFEGAGGGEDEEEPV